MSDRIRLMFHRFPRFFQWMSKIYQKFFAPLKTGHLQYYMKYCLKDKQREIKLLKKYELSNIATFNYREWRIGRGKDGAFRRYYTAMYHGKKCFVKIGIHDATVRNEFMILTELQKQGVSFSPQMLVGDRAFDTERTMVAVEFLNDLQKFTVPNDKKKFEKICKQFAVILRELQKRGLVHADIHKGNLMLQGEKLILMDYGISRFQNMPNEINYLHRPGTFYRKKENGRIYDDAYSFVKMIEALNVSEEFTELEAFQTIKGMIDQNSFYVSLEQ